MPRLRPLHVGFFTRLCSALFECLTVVPVVQQAVLLSLTKTYNLGEDGYCDVTCLGRQTAFLRDTPQFLTCWFADNSWSDNLTISVNDPLYLQPNTATAAILSGLPSSSATYQPAFNCSVSSLTCAFHCPRLPWSICFWHNEQCQFLTVVGPNYDARQGLTVNSESDFG